MLDYHILEKFQNTEKEYAKEISKLLDIKLFILEDSNIENIHRVIKSIKKSRIFYSKL